MSRQSSFVHYCLVYAALTVGLMIGQESMAADGYLIGFTQPNVAIDVAFSQPGRVKTLHVEVGQAIEKGELLAGLDEGPLPLTLEIAKVRATDESSIDSAKAKVEGLSRRVDDLTKLADSGGASPEEVRKVATDLKVAQAELEQAIATQEVQKLEVTRLEMERELRQVKAPFSGHVTKIEKRPGEYVAVSQPSVMEIVQLDPLRIEFHVSVEELANLKVGQSVSVTLLPNKETVEASVQRISRVVDPQSGTTLVELSLPNEALKYQSGLKCRWNLSSTTCATAPATNESVSK